MGWIDRPTKVYLYFFSNGFKMGKGGEEEDIIILTVNEINGLKF